MSNSRLAKVGAIFFALWGLLHVIGGGLILATNLQGEGLGFSYYQNSAGTYPPLADAILSYFAYNLVWLGLLVACVAMMLNWRNSHVGLALNTALVGLADLGLVMFLVLPGYVSWQEALLGIGLFAAALVPSTLACRDAMEIAAK